MLGFESEKNSPKAGGTAGYPLGYRASQLSPFCNYKIRL